MKDEQIIVKRLWVLHYSRGSHVQYMQAFYAESESVAQAQARKFLKQFGRSAMWESLELMPEGFGGGSSYLPGEAHFVLLHDDDE
jgi:hypothetical protein